MHSQFTLVYRGKLSIPIIFVLLSIIPQIAENEENEDGRGFAILVIVDV